MFTRISVSSLPPLTVTAARLTLAALLLLPLMRLAGQRLPRGWLQWRWILLAALFGYALPFALISWGQVAVNAGLTAIFMAVMPLATLGIAHLLTDDEKLNGWKLAGVLLGLLGVIILMGVDALTHLGGETLREIAILGGALCYAINAIVTKKLTAAPRLSMMSALLLSASLIMLPPALLLDRPWTLTADTAALLSIVALAILPTALATLIILVLVDRQGASFLSQINFMVPVFGMVFGSLLLAEEFPANAYAALIVILAGVALSRRGSRST